MWIDYEDPGSRKYATAAHYFVAKADNVDGKWDDAGRVIPGGELTTVLTEDRYFTDRSLYNTEPLELHRLPNDAVAGSLETRARAILRGSLWGQRHRKKS